MRKSSKSEKGNASLKSVVKEVQKAKTSIVRAVKAQSMNAIVPSPAIDLPLPPTAQQVLAVAQRQIDIRKGYIKLIAQQLRPEEVLVFGGRDTEQVYLPKKTCMDILSWAQIHIEFDGPMEEHRYSSPDGDYLEFVINAVITDGSGRPVPVIGNRSTRDEFFGTSGKERLCTVCKKKATYDFPYKDAKYKGWFCKDHPKDKPEEIVHYLPLYDVDIASVRQAAVANLWNHALEAIGLRPTLLDLQEANMDISKVKKIGFSSSREEERKPAPSKQTAKAESPKQDKPIMETEYVDPAKSECQECHSSFGVHLMTCSKFKKPGTAGKPPEKAVIPGEETTVKGIIEAKNRFQAKNKAIYWKITVGGVVYYLFDNKEKAVSGDRKAKVFELLELVMSGSPCEFIVRPREVEGVNKPQIFNVLRIGEYEWEPDGTPVLRRDSEGFSEGLPFEDREAGDESS